MTQAQVERVGRQWQQRFKVGHWEVEFKAVQADKFPFQDGYCHGNCNWNMETLTATIQVAALQKTDADVVSTIVHELLHLVIVPIVWAGYMAASQLHPDADRLAREMLDLEHERAVRSLERGFASMIDENVRRK